MQYNLKEHPRYDLLYEPGKKKTSSNLLKKYDHLPKVREYEENLKFAKVCQKGIRIKNGIVIKR